MRKADTRIDSLIRFLTDSALRCCGHGVAIAFTAVYWLEFSLVAQTSTNSGLEEIPPLRPPRGQVPPGFWEQHGSTLLGSGLILLIVICLALWFVFRVRPRVAVTPAVQARQALDALLGQPESGIVLSHVSQTLRRYIVAAFGLLPGEHNTTEFCEAISSNASVGPKLSAEVCEFLRSCDQRKFALVTDSTSLDAVAQALKFVEQSEQRCAELRKLEQNAEGSRG